MPVGNRYSMVQPTSDSVRRNPYVIVLACLAAAFLVTAAFYCGSLLSGYLEAQSSNAESTFAQRWQFFTIALLVVELVGMITATVAAANFEDAAQARFDASTARGDI